MRDEKEMKHKIIVRTLSNRILTFTVSKYEINNGFVEFTDERTNEKKSFHGSNCEIIIGDAQWLKSKAAL